MTVKELKEKLNNVPDYADVFITQNNTEFDVSLAENAGIKRVIFTEDTEYDDSDPNLLKAEDDVFIITDEY